MSARLPIRWRLTLWYAALLALSLAAFAAVIYFGLRANLYSTFDDQLRAQADVIRSAVQTTGGSLALKPAETNDPTSGEHFVRLIDRQGHVVTDTSASLGGLSLNPSLVTAALAGHTHLTSVSVEGETLRVITVPVLHGDQVTGVLQVGLFRSEVQEALDQLLSLLILSIPLVLVIAAGGGYLLARSALSPVASITALAERVTGKDLHARLGLTLPDDELGRLARTFDAMLARVEAAFNRQRQFTGDAAHELRTPLTLMRGQIDLALARPRSAEEYRAALQELDGDLERLTRLVSTLLTLARAGTGKLAPERLAFDVAETIGLVLEQYAGSAAEHDIIFRNETKPATVFADEDQIVQVLVNLMDNALMHTPAGGTVTISCQPARTETRFWVADTGDGIPEPHLAHVFDRFYRVESGRTRERGGAGLGLSICKAIVEANGGTIALTSEAGHGTKVEVRLPVPDEADRSLRLTRTSSSAPTVNADLAMTDRQEAPAGKESR